MAKPRKMDLYLAEGRRLAELVNAYRATKAAASEETPVEPTKKKRKSYRLPPLETPTPIPGFPFAGQGGEAKDIPDYGSIGRVKAIRATQAARVGKRAPLKPIGPSELRKKGQQHDD
jgi:hypothetical protein